MSPLVFHISDVHIRAGGRERCRAAEYSAAIEGAVAAADRALSPAPESERLVVVAGDVFHDKGAVGKAGIELFFSLVRGLSRAARVIVIRGNHDYVQERYAPGDAHCDTGDVIEALLSEAPVERVTYLRDTGLAEFPPFGFGILGVQDCCSRGGTAAQDVACPALPDPSGFGPAVEHRVALFHGVVPGGGVTARWLAGYDAGILGDVHDRGAWTSPAGAPLRWGERWPRGECAWAYSGSLVQQNHGEAPFTHGALLWDFGERRISAIDVASPHVFLTLWRPRWPGCDNRNVERRADEVNCRENEADGWMVSAGGGSRPLSEAAGSLPARATVRVFAPVEYRGSPEHAATAALRGLGCEVSRATVAHGQPGFRDISFLDDGRYGTSSGEAAEGAPGCFGAQCASTPPGGLRSFHSPETWGDHVASKGDPSILAGAPFRDWLRSDGASLCVSSPTGFGSWGLPAAKLEERNDRVRKTAAAADCVSQFSEAFEPGKGGLLSFSRLSWNWMLCYGAGSTFDFSRARRRVVMINGPNASGKSSFLEVLVLALFGEPPPTRASKENAASCINRGAPAVCGAENTPSTRLVFSASGVEYVLRREFRRKKGSPEKLGACGAWLETAGYGCSGREVRSGRPAVDRWVSENVGDIGAFMMSSMLSQERDSDFFSMRPSEQRDVIDSALNAEGMSKCLDAIDESRRAHKWTADLLETAAASRKQALPSGTRRDFVESGRSVAEARRRTGEAVAGLWGAAVLHAVRWRRLDLLEARAAEEAAARRDSGDPAGVGSAGDAPPPVPEEPSPAASAVDLESDAAALREELSNASAELEALMREPEPDAVPLLEGSAERAHFAAPAPSQSACSMRRKAEKHEARCRRVSELRGLLAASEALEARGPFSKGCPSCESRLRRAAGETGAPVAADVASARSELAELEALEPGIKSARYASLAAAAGAWEDADPGWRALRESRAVLAGYLATRRELDEKRRDLESRAESASRAAALRRAWDARVAWEGRESTAEFGGLTAVKPDAGGDVLGILDAARVGLSGALSARTSAMSAAKAARRGLRLAREHRAAVVDRRIGRSRAAAEISRIWEAAEQARRTEAALGHVHALVAEYGETTYRSSVSEALETGVRAVLACMGAGDILLRTEWGQKGFSFWTDCPSASGVSERLPLEKASGYQRASLGLALRIALSRLGASSVRCSQLFLDEAFGSFDERNRGGVGDFLRGLLATYESVVLVSHVLPEDARDDCVTIGEAPSGGKMLVF